MFGSHIHLVGKHPTLISIVRSALSRDEKNPVDSHHQGRKRKSHESPITRWTNLGVLFLSRQLSPSRKKPKSRWKNKRNCRPTTECVRWSSRLSIVLLAHFIASAAACHSCTRNDRRQRAAPRCCCHRRARGIKIAPANHRKPPRRECREAG